MYADNAECHEELETCTNNDLNMVKDTLHGELAYRSPGRRLKNNLIQIS